uniref:hypothetical protein n=1 Tax=Faecalicatena contorta TaxID=39482 RepID=UPI00359C8DC1
MIYFWKNVKITTGGIIPIRDAAAMICQRIVVSLSRLYTTSVKGYLFASDSRNSGTTNSL